MKIAFITNNYTPIISGITSSINSYVQSLRELGHTVYIVAPRFPGYEDEQEYVVRTPSVAVYYREKYPISVVTSKSLAKVIEQLSIDLVHTHHPFGLGATALRSAKRLSIPIMVLAWFSIALVTLLYIEYIAAHIAGIEMKINTNIRQNCFYLVSKS